MNKQELIEYVVNECEVSKACGERAALGPVSAMTNDPIGKRVAGIIRLNE